MSGGLTPTMPDVVHWHGSSIRGKDKKEVIMPVPVIIAIAEAVTIIATAYSTTKKK